MKMCLREWPREPVGAACMRPLQVPSLGLLAFDGLEQCLEVAGTEALGALPLDDLVEERGAVLDGLGEDLQEVALVIPVYENPELLEWRDILVDMAHPVEHRIVVVARHPEELYTALAQRRDRLDDVIRGNGDVLTSGAMIELEILVDLALPAPLRWFVERELDAAIAVG